MNTQWQELLIAYSVSATSMLLGLLIMRAADRAYWRWPVYSAMVMVLGVVLWNLLRRHALPAQWIITHPTAIYYGALALYALLALALGLLVGKMVPGRETGKTRNRR
jgi:hypothetical protein